MILGVGVDIVDIARFTRALERTPKLGERLFTDAERELPANSLAGRFAAKEALIKAFTPQTLVWASDWPFLRAPARLDYGPLRALVDDWFPQAADRQAVLWDTPRRLFGWGL